MSTTGHANGEAVRLDHQLLTPTQVAELLQLPPSTVYELARQGRLPCLRIGRAIRFSQSDLEHHLVTRRESGPTRASRAE